jgi:hypothetical protein
VSAGVGEGWYVRISDVDAFQAERSDTSQRVAIAIGPDALKIRLRALGISEADEEKGRNGESAND